jgi:hypothetical protein
VKGLSRYENALLVALGVFVLAGAIAFAVATPPRPDVRVVSGPDPR